MRNWERHDHQVRNEVQRSSNNICRVAVAASSSDGGIPIICQRTTKKKCLQNHTDCPHPNYSHCDKNANPRALLGAEYTQVEEHNRRLDQSQHNSI